MGFPCLFYDRKFTFPFYVITHKTTSPACCSLGGRKYFLNYSKNDTGNFARNYQFLAHGRGGPFSLDI